MSHLIAILIAADEEWRIVKEILNPADKANSPFGETFSFSFDDGNHHRSASFFQTGCGKILSAAAAQYVLDTFNPDCIVGLGTCGGFETAVNSGEILYSLTMRITGVS